MGTINVVREIKELKTHLSYSRNIGFFFGAGTSCSLNIPNIEQLTTIIESILNDENKKTFILIKDDLAKPSLKAITIPKKISKTTPAASTVSSAKSVTKSPTITTAASIAKKVNIEDILNQIRRIRELTCESTKEYQGVSGESAKNLDKEICTKIYNIIFEKEKVANLENTKKFFAWLSILNRDFSKEIFTTNYDLIIEKSLEASSIPYFDGFVGSFEPFFLQTSVDTIDISKDDLTKNWIRLWKIHGSLSWFWKEDEKTKSQKIIRIGKIDNIEDEENELVIYPSKDKYDSSRKQPFIAYFDRLKNYLLNGELLFIFTGYSFSDQHINEIIFNCLRQNNRLSGLVFFYKDEEVENLHKLASSYMNLTVFGPKKAILNGNLCEWEFDKTELQPSEKFEHYWNEAENKLTLGDFNSLVNFLIINSGKKDAIEAIIK